MYREMHRVADEHCFNKNKLAVNYYLQIKQ